MVKSPSRVSGLGEPHSARQSSGASFARRRAPSAVGAFFLGRARRRSLLHTGPAFDTMELRMPLGYPGAAVGGGDALDGPGFFALNAVQQPALFAFWTAPGGR